MAKEIPKGYEKAENQEFESPEEAYRFIKGYCNKCREMKIKEKCAVNKKLKEALADRFSYWADAFMALDSIDSCLERKVHCFDFIKK